MKHDPVPHSTDAELLEIADAIAALTPSGIMRLIDAADARWRHDHPKRLRFWENLRMLFTEASNPKLARPPRTLNVALVAIMERARRACSSAGKLN